MASHTGVDLLDPLDRGVDRLAYGDPSPFLRRAGGPAPPAEVGLNSTTAAPAVIRGRCPGGG